MPQLKVVEELRIYNVTIIMDEKLKQISTGMDGVTKRAGILDFELFLETNFYKLEGLFSLKINNIKFVFFYIFYFFLFHLYSYILFTKLIFIALKKNNINNIT